MKGGVVHNNHHFTGKKGKQNRRKSRNRMRKKRVHKNKYEIVKGKRNGKEQEVS